MAAILTVKDSNGNIIEIPAIQGSAGKSAYQSAKDGGYSGTEEEFYAALGSIGENNGGSALPEVTTDDNGKFLIVVDGAWTVTTLPSAEEASF